jgi:kinesin family protein 5
MLSPDSSQSDVYEKVEPIVKDVLLGYNATIFAYGQTASGKTHTMEGPSISLAKSNSKLRGMTSRVIGTLVRGVAAQIKPTADNEAALVPGQDVPSKPSDPGSVEFSLKLSMVEIYMEKIRDLLDYRKEKKNLKVFEHRSGGTSIDGAREVTFDLNLSTITNDTSSSKSGGRPFGAAAGPAAATADLEGAVLKLMEQGALNRAKGATGLNEGSSRSHSIVILTVHQIDRSDEALGSTREGKLYMVDLAGSEKVHKLQTPRSNSARGGDQHAMRLEEGKTINKSLTTLGMVINALTDGVSKHIPYRDSKLTRVLQQSVGGNARTALLVCCSPSNTNKHETLSTLRFGSRAKLITNNAQINEQPSAAQLASMLKHAQDEIVRLRMMTLGTAQGQLNGSTQPPNLQQQEDDPESSDVGGASVDVVGSTSAVSTSGTVTITTSSTSGSASSSVIGSPVGAPPAITSPIGTPPGGSSGGDIFAAMKQMRLELERAKSMTAMREMQQQELRAQLEGQQALVGRMRQTLQEEREKAAAKGKRIQHGGAAEEEVKVKDQESGDEETRSLQQQQQQRQRQQQQQAAQATARMEEMQAEMEALAANNQKLALRQRRLQQHVRSLQEQLQRQQQAPGNSVVVQRRQQQQLPLELESLQQQLASEKKHAEAEAQQHENELHRVHLQLSEARLEIKTARAEAEQLVLEARDAARAEMRGELESMDEQLRTTTHSLATLDASKGALRQACAAYLTQIEELEGQLQHADVAVQRKRRELKKEELENQRLQKVLRYERRTKQRTEASTSSLEQQLKKQEAERKKLVSEKDTMATELGRARRYIRKQRHADVHGEPSDERGEKSLGSSWRSVSPCNSSSSSASSTPKSSSSTPNSSRSGGFTPNSAGGSVVSLSNSVASFSKQREQNRDLVCPQGHRAHHDEAHGPNTCTNCHSPVEVGEPILRCPSCQWWSCRKCGGHDGGEPEEEDEGAKAAAASKRPKKKTPREAYDDKKATEHKKPSPVPGIGGIAKYKEPPRYMNYVSPLSRRQLQREKIDLELREKEKAQKDAKTRRPRTKSSERKTKSLGGVVHYKEPPRYLDFVSPPSRRQLAAEQAAREKRCADQRKSRIPRMRSRSKDATKDGSKDGAGDEATKGEARDSTPSGSTC